VGRRSGVAKKNYIPDDVTFQTKPQIALDLIDRAKANGVRVKAWTCDELYGRDGRFLDGLDQRGEAFVAEVPSNFYAWIEKPKILRKPPKNRQGRPKSYPRRSRRRRSSQVQNLRKFSPAFRDQRWQRYLVKETRKGPEVWEIQWDTCWRKAHDDSLISRQCTLIVARHVLTGEVKYFLSNRVAGRDDGWTLRGLLRVAFGRWQVEACFREAKEELGLDHFECRGWRCVHRHLYVTILGQLFCARVRQRFAAPLVVSPGEALTVEQVRRATTVYIDSTNLPRPDRHRRYEEELERQRYYQHRNAQAAKSHRKTRRARLRSLGIDPDKIKSCHPKDGNQ